MCALALGGDQYPSDQMIAQRGETMAMVRGGPGHADCFSKWRGAAGRIMAYSGQGRGWYRPRFRWKRLPVVAERMWLRRRPFLEGAKGQVRVSAGQKAGFGDKRRGRGDTVLAIGKPEEKKDKQPGVLGCGSRGWSDSKETKLTETEDCLLAEKKRVAQREEDERAVCFQANTTTW